MSKNRDLKKAIDEIHRLQKVIHDVEARDTNLLENYRLAIDNHSIVAITDFSGKITFVNDTFCEISRYNREELVGKDHRIVNSGYHPKGFFQQMWGKILGGEIWQGKIRNKTKAGSPYWVQTTIVPFKNVNGNIDQFYSIRTDITESVLNEERLANAHQKLLKLTERLKAERMILNQKNIALNELINHVEEEKEKIRTNMNQNLETVIFPLIEQLKKGSHGLDAKYLDLLCTSLQEVSSPALKNLNTISAALTPKELQICHHIKNGMSVKEIAAHYNLSPRTIDKHRENIRKKLGIQSKKVNLTTFLRERL